MTKSGTTVDTVDSRRARSLFGTLTEPVDFAVNSFLQVGDIEVDQQPDTQPAQSQIREQLSVVDWKNRLDCLNFDNHDFIDEQIDPIAELDRESFIPDGKLLLGWHKGHKAHKGHKGTERQHAIVHPSS